MKTLLLGLLLLCYDGLIQQAAAQASAAEESHIVVQNEGWELMGDLLMPASEAPAPAVLMLNQAAGDRAVYADLARRLVDRGIASLRLDLRGHGESTNLGAFVPGEQHATDLLKVHPDLAERIAVWLAQRFGDEEVRFRQMLEEQAARYPLMELQDLYKLIHQAAMGSEHAVSDPAAHRWMEREIAALADGPDDPLFDPLTPDSQLVRVHLRPYLAGGGDPDALVRAFVETANTYPGSVDRLRRYWQYAERSAEAGVLPFNREAMAAYLAEQAEAGYPAVHHSAQYEAAYAPAYRVVARQHLEALEQ